ncbi:VanZ family protein [Flavobacteriaceae bacterium M23B6Z8]
MPKLDLQFSFGDKLVHLIFYLVLTILLYLYLRKEHQKYQKRKVLTIASVFSLIYGMIIEVLQGILPYKRSADWLDVVANSVGIVFAILIIVMVIDKSKALKRVN